MDEALSMKVEADVFEAVVGGLYQDGCHSARGYTELQVWFDTLIEPWIDYQIAYVVKPGALKGLLNLNYIPLDTDPIKDARRRIEAGDGRPMDLKAERAYR